MDIFKLLTRSTSLKRGRVVVKDQPLPSAGQAPAPQSLSRGRDSSRTEISPKLGKRKRQSAAVQEIAPEIDFFSTASKAQPAVVNDASDYDDHGVEQTLQVLEVEDPEEWKQELKKHKVKIAILQDSKTAVAEDADAVEAGHRKVKRRREQTEESRRQKMTQAIIRPLQTFSELQGRYGVGRRLAQNVEGEGYRPPTEIQVAAIPILMGDRLVPDTQWTKDAHEMHREAIDLLAVAPTGSGKTLAFLIPIIQSLMNSRKTTNESSNGPRALVIAPTRELAAQIVNEARKLTLNTGLRVTLIKKGMKVGSDEEVIIEDSSSSSAETDEESQEDDLAPTIANDHVSTVKSDILVATPLAIVHALRRSGNVHALLPSIEYLVLDEADVLLDELFQKQTLSIWEACINEGLRLSLWSATMSSSIESLAVSMIQSRITDTETPSHIVRLIVGIKDTALSTVRHKLTYAATEPGKLMALRQLLHPSAPVMEKHTSEKGEVTPESTLRPPFLVFTQTIPRAIALHAELRYDIPPEAGGSMRIAVLHAGLSETARSNVMARFRSGEIWVIITTDLLARGIDFRGLNGVVNYDVPTSAAAYVHRAGRTGRAGRIGGMVVTMYTKEDIAHIKPIVNLIAASEKAAYAAGTQLHGTDGVQQWLLDALPTPTKQDKRKLKQRGVEARRAGVKSAHISTKPPDRRGFRKSKRGPHVESLHSTVAAESAAVDDFDGFED